MEYQGFHQTFYQLFYYFKQAYLSLRKKPGFVFSVVATMGLSLGTLLCALTLAYITLIKPLPYPEQDKLYQLTQHSINKKGEIEFSGFDYPTTLELYKKQQSLTKIAISYHSEAVILSHPKQILVKTSFVTPEWFLLLGVTFDLGRVLDEEEGVNTNIPVAILSYKTWQKYYHADNNIINKTININDVNYKVIGVTAADFIDPQLNKSGFDTQVWLPWDFNPISYKKDWWGSYSNNLIIFGQKVEDLSVSQVNQQTYNLICQIIAPAVAQDFADPCTNIRIETKTLKKAMIGDSNTIIYLLLAGALSLVIIATTNIINLFIAHIAEQLNQFAINAAVGAKKRHLVLALFIQVSILMLAANLLSFFIASGGFYLINRYLNEFLPLVSQLKLQTVIVISLVFLSVLLTIVIAKLGASAINYRCLNLRLQSGGKGINSQVSAKIRRSLIICQIAIASVLVFCCVNLMLNAVEKISKPLGYQRNNLSYLSISTSQTENEVKRGFEQTFALNKQIKAALLARPEIKNVSTAESPIGSFMKLSINDIDTNIRHVVETSFGDENYFNLIGQPLIAGDNFAIQTKQHSDQVLIVNETFAKTLVPDGEVIGKKLDFSNDGSNVYTIIGIVKGILAPGAKEIPLRMYAPASTLAAKFLIQFQHKQDLTREQLIITLKNVSGLLAISQYKSLADSFNHVLQVERITLVSTIAMTIVSLLLAALGLYGVLSYSTQIRRFEIGTRMAIGAKRRDIINLIIKDNISSFSAGVIVSIIIITSLILGFNKQLNDYLNWQLLPLFLLTLLLISVISFCACYLPLRKYINKPALYSMRGSE